MRKSLAHAFSPRSLIEQEYLISKNIDAFIQKIHQDGSRGVDIAMAFTLMSFDVIGDLGFGETFKGIESSRDLHKEVVELDCLLRSTEDVHPWIDRMTGAMMQGAVADCFNRFPTLAKIAWTLFGRHIRSIIEDTKINERYSIELVER